MMRLRQLLRRCRRGLAVLSDRDVFISPTTKLVSERHGSAYGGWVIRADSLNERSVVVSAGLGHDITFDLSVIEKYKCKVVGYDPDPRAYAYHDSGNFPAGFEWRKSGLGEKSEKAKFYRPLRADWISGTLVQGAISHSTEFDLVEILDVVEVLDSFRGGIDVLKMDIEGAEYAVVDRLISSGHIKKIRQLLIEFHHGKKYSGSDTKRSVESILNTGFQLFFVSDLGYEFSFCRSDG